MMSVYKQYIVTHRVEQMSHVRFMGLLTQVTRCYCLSRMLGEHRDKDLSRQIFDSVTFRGL